MSKRETWLINGSKLEYDDVTHTYWCDGIKCISVTQLLHHKFPKKYDGVSIETLQNAANLGTEIHEAIEIYEIYGLEREDLEEFRNYQFLKDKFGFKVLKNEIPIILKYKDLTICGRLDLVISEDNKLGLGDIKRTSVLDKEYLAYQLNLYRLGYQQSYGESIDLLRGIHLRKSTRKYVKLPINEEATYELLEQYRKEIQK